LVAGLGGSEGLRGLTVSSPGSLAILGLFGNYGVVHVDVHQARQTKQHDLDIG
jgi:hypothetical protein